MMSTKENQSFQEIPEKITWREFIERDMKTTGEPDETAIIVELDDIYRDTYFVSNKRAYDILNESIRDAYPQNRWQNFGSNQKNSDTMLRTQSDLLQLFSQYSKELMDTNDIVKYNEFNGIDANVSEQGTSLNDIEVEQEQQPLQVVIDDDESTQKAVHFMVKDFDKQAAAFSENTHQLEEEIQSTREDMEMIDNMCKLWTSSEPE